MSEDERISPLEELYKTVADIDMFRFPVKPGGGTRRKPWFSRFEARAIIIKENQNAKYIIEPLTIHGVTYDEFPVRYMAKNEIRTKYPPEKMITQVANVFYLCEMKHNKMIGAYYSLDDAVFAYVRWMGLEATKRRVPPIYIDMLLASKNLKELIAYIREYLRLEDQVAAKKAVRKARAIRNILNRIRDKKGTLDLIYESYYKKIEALKLRCAYKDTEIKELKKLVKAYERQITYHNANPIVIANPTLDRLHYENRYSAMYCKGWDTTLAEEQLSMFIAAERRLNRKLEDLHKLEETQTKE